MFFWQERSLVSSEERAAVSTSGRDWLDEAMRTDASLMFLPGQVRSRKRRQGAGAGERCRPVLGDRAMPADMYKGANRRPNFVNCSEICQLL